MTFAYGRRGSTLTNGSKPGHCYTCTGNAKRSICLGLFDGDNLVPAGNVTIPPNHRVPAPGDVVDVRYMHAFREGGSIYQPVYVGPRSDIPASECGADQLKYKGT